MDKSKHTPGPWAIDWNISRLDIHADGKLIATLRRSTSDGPPTYDDANAKGNARLIAAAPELLEACKRAFDQTDKGARPADWEMLRSAIARATGATP